MIGDEIQRLFHANNNNGWADDFISFEAPLITSLVPTKARGSSTPTYTGATTKYQTDFEGKLNLCLSGEARFQGARRVYNQVSWDVSGWTTINSGSVSSGQTDPFGGTGAYKFTSSGADGFIRQTGLTGTARVSMWLRSDDVTAFNAAIGGTDENFTITSTWQRYTIAVRTGTTFLIGGASKVASGKSFYVYAPQFEDVTGQANQNPAEIVSNGVLSAPYHGAGVDGVKYFDTLNGNTVASNVVTEATGAKIVTGASGVASTAPVDAFGPYGYLAEGARTNICLQSQTLDHATWTGAASGMTVTANAAVAPDGTTTMDALVPSNATTNHYIYQTGMARTASAPVCIEFYAKKSGYDFITVQLDDSGGGNCLQSWNLTTGAVGAASAGTWTINSTAIEAQADGSYRCRLVATGPSGTVLQCAIGTGDTAATLNTAGNGVKLTYVWGVQIQNNVTFGSTYIPTTTASVTRNGDVLRFATAGNAAFDIGTAYAEVTSTGWGTSRGADARILLDSGVANAALYVDDSAFVGFYDGTSERRGAAYTPSSSIQKIASTWGGSSAASTANGATPSNLSFDGGMNWGATFEIGGGNDANYAWYGTLRNIRIRSRKVSNAALQAMTA